MTFPGNLTAILNDRNVTKIPKPVKDERLPIGEPRGQDLLALVMISSQTETISDNLTGWVVTDVSPSEIKVELSFS